MAMGSISPHGWKAWPKPGGICISGTVHDQIETKLALEYEYLGEQTVKNIAKPVRVYRVGMEPATATPCRGASRPSIVDSLEICIRTACQDAAACLTSLLSPCCPLPT